MDYFSHPYWNIYDSYLQSYYLPQWLANSTTVLYKCKHGKMCKQKHKTCMFIHPGQVGYQHAHYYQSTIPCQYESDSSACRLKCGHSNGRYCPFLHCSHRSMELTSIRCPRLDCQRHCPHCI